MPNPFRRSMLLRALAAMAGAAVPAVRAADRVIEIWKDPSCGCCAEWVRHLRSHGFSATVHDTGNRAARARLGMPATLASCHTGLVRGYVIEGHVPAADIARLLDEKPVALGLAVPGMPVGSPGMEMGDRRDPYDVLLVAKTGGTTIFQSYR